MVSEMDIAHIDITEDILAHETFLEVLIRRSNANLYDII